MNYDKAKLEEQIRTVKSHHYVISNFWYRIGFVNAYIRIHPNRLELANVNVDEKKRSKGHFTAFLEYLEGLDKPVVIENVFNHRLEDFLRRRGYVSNHSEPPSFTYNKEFQ